MNFYKSHTSQWPFPLQEPRELKLSNSHIVILWLQNIGEPLLRLYGHTHKPVCVDWTSVQHFSNSSNRTWLWFPLWLQNRKVKFTLSVILAVKHIHSKHSLGPNHLFIVHQKTTMIFACPIIKEQPNHVCWCSDLWLESLGTSSV